MVGVQHLDSVEDAVQTALMTALTSWVANGLPEDPGAWLYRVAQPPDWSLAESCGKAAHT